MDEGNVASHRRPESRQNYIPQRRKGAKTGRICVLLGLAPLREKISLFIMVSLRKYGGDRLRQEPERSSRCMPGYLMQLVKTRRGKQLPTMNWLSLPN